MPLRLGRIPFVAGSVRPVLSHIGENLQKRDFAGTVHVPATGVASFEVLVPDADGRFRGIVVGRLWPGHRDWDGPMPIPLSGTTSRHTFVDAADYEWLRGYTWHESDQGYAAGWVDGRIVTMHRVIMGLRVGDGLEVDHINFDRLNNTRGNLRVVTKSANRRHIRQKRGCARLKQSGRWQAYARDNNKQISLGTYGTEEEARAVSLAFRTSVDVREGIASPSELQAAGDRLEAQRKAVERAVARHRWDTTEEHVREELRRSCGVEVDAIPCFSGCACTCGTDCPCECHPNNKEDE